ncbi:hypothetical protein SM0020_29645 [Sinorhizobium meliloti CCNWSX0020]|uniref:Uncharacterized protein n=1 Tax=Sinorhizobium meliloti CCNWSX0020 TaxID=1107881 RepID=H0G8T8_RHIML|nr:hypothetical protein SM0020_29645 [Sinorhizobium meliloti CCNWSX0020]PII38525.1 hypothetical protein T190_19410 [Sinorhizobium meliloti CCBAU 01290]
MLCILAVPVKPSFNYELRKDFLQKTDVIRQNCI